MQGAAFHLTRRGPFALDKGFPSKPDLPGTTKVMVRTWCLEAIRCVTFVFLTTRLVFGSLCFFVVEERSYILKCSSLRRIHYKVDHIIAVYGQQTGN